MTARWSPGSGGARTQYLYLFRGCGEGPPSQRPSDQKCKRTCVLTTRCLVISSQRTAAPPTSLGAESTLVLQPCITMGRLASFEAIVTYALDCSARLRQVLATPRLHRCYLMLGTSEHELASMNRAFYRLPVSQNAVTSALNGRAPTSLRNTSPPRGLLSKGE